MHIHILGICGTFMGGIAAIARESGHKVTGCDTNVYPPMSTQLESQGIELIEGYSPEQVLLDPDIFVIGNVISRGNPLMEEILNRNLSYTSGPQWLSENILKNKWVLAIAGTHGKTTTSSMLAWILEYAGMNPGFLIGGVPENFGISARIGVSHGASNNTESPAQCMPEISSFFVIEADEYDTAFFDKRSKFVHYHPRTVVLNNLEFDHADIFSDLAAIERQFHHLVRLVPSGGLIISNSQEDSLKRVLAAGCWTPVEEFGTDLEWQAAPHTANNQIGIYYKNKLQGTLQWGLLGAHNALNALAAMIAARHAGVPIQVGIEALAQFKNVKRRMEVKGIVNNITIYDDFAHHPTSIRATISGLRNNVGSANIIAVLEPRSNTMRMGVWKDDFANSLMEADQIFCYLNDSEWDARAALHTLDKKYSCHDDLMQLITSISSIVRPGDHVLIMSNGSFGGIHEKLLALLSENH
ncbi:UDP-N-acetylmuramate: L-alanyl-gamma-D-glutamyl-meso-diaminopimelate ligase [Nitrosomonas cryotolerans]|uniref:UDP-N-acetylmuramate--L-alanyl-gamma-D-glutamyl-meso-2,6-diaminoheptandioate ligase n=1 Tax=Nitrosomonas cryotolerans ATCC 49181 TaxID=1131553 RepID=A0A1N6IQ98_9PROT|nr:UDP-N-acetylmuramate:L-alanyl-gamma-D-glutamyl-meso-diaminopimelate ligase [Nitrosomonas cryotolerans]SFP34637.1 UDP-N-acetylmuramate: L-alanyl-gamma-D-glutamyl-meso-diaminopimelate ligase [Nitrosomonas cryotolerans]SIO34202.1 UDP-N-acetylmuramate: L-alanyl-gamma-D-glutamyl-meso-diaminopimelate ligase [Nitrosomonas cryotolerans ATCC 49181]